MLASILLSISDPKTAYNDHIVYQGSHDMDSVGKVNNTFGYGRFDASDRWLSFSSSHPDFLKSGSHIRIDLVAGS